MKSFTKGVVWTLGSLFLLVIVLAIIGMVAYNGYNEATLKYSKGDTETSIKLEKKDIKKSNKEKSTELYSQENPNGKYEGEKKDDIPHGKGKMFWANGDYYEGNWDNGKPKGYGKKLFTLDNGDKYEGETIDGLPHGLGRYSYVNGDIFEGEYENGTQKQNGYGLYKFVNGDTLKSYWVNKNGSLLPEGQGQYTYINGDVFIGEYKNGKMFYGTYELKSLGDVYTGFIKDDKWNGQGLYRWKNGQTYDGNWVDGFATGFGKLEYADGRTYKGYFVKGLRQGEGILQFTDGRKLEGKFQNDEFIGNKDLIVEKENKIILSTNEKYYALVIGNNKYEHLEKLDAAENDAIVIAEVLENKYDFEVDLLLNADYDTTVNSLFSITNKLKNNDNLLIYYAGHGELDKAENRGYWLPVDASYEMRSKWISNQRIVDRIKATKAKHVLLVADSCFSGTLMRSGTNLQNQEPINEKYVERLKNKKTRLVITSGGNEPVVDSVGGNHSLFALKFIDTLKNSKNVINSQILFENIRRYVVANADQTPERAMVHKTGHDGGDFLFFPN